MKKIFLLFAVAGFALSTSAATLNGGDDKDKKGKKCNKEAKACCKKSGEAKACAKAGEAKAETKSETTTTKAEDKK